jgi:hypothetical protein
MQNTMSEAMMRRTNYFGFESLAGGFGYWAVSAAVRR